MKSMWLALCAALPLVFPHPVEAAEVTVELLEPAESTYVVNLRGEIVLGDDERLHRIVRNLPRGSRVDGIVLSSTGGAVVEASRLAETVRNSRLTTFVASNQTCASACFLVFAAGTRRMASASARIGVHSVSSGGDESTEAVAVTTALARDAVVYGVPDSIIGRLLRTPPHEMAWLSHADLRAMGVSIHQFYRIERGVSTGIGSGARRRREWRRSGNGSHRVVPTGSHAPYLTASDATVTSRNVVVPVRL